MANTKVDCPFCKKRLVLEDDEEKTLRTKTKVNIKCPFCKKIFNLKECPEDIERYKNKNFEPEKRKNTYSWVIVVFLILVIIYLWIDLETANSNLEDYKSCVNDCVLDNEDCLSIEPPSMGDVEVCSAELEECLAYCEV
jgi:transposase-like protein